MKDLIALTVKAYREGYRYIIHEGGTRSGKTHANLSTLYHITNSRHCVSSVISETMPHLRKGAIRDYQRILLGQKAWDENKWNKTDSVHTLGDGKLLEFFSADSPDKVHGPERDNLFINEAQNISYDIARQLFVRTKKTVFIDFNPTREFWVHTELKDDPRTIWIHSTYKDNPYLTDEQVAEIERNKHNKAWWNIYGKGILAESEGLVYKGWKLIDEIPHEARLERRGLDFGYTNDPSAVVEIYYYNGGYILNERLYRKGMSNQALAEFLNNLDKPHTLVIADSAEPKSIDEIAAYGVPIVGANKGKGSVRTGIDWIQDQQMSVTKRSTNLIKEYRGYLWQTDRDGKTLNEPEKGQDHALDATRYGMESLRVKGVDDEDDDYQSGNITQFWQQ